MFFAFAACLMLLPLLIVIRVDDAVLQSHVARFKEALRLADISMEKSCEWRGINYSQSMRQLDGDGHISFTRMMLLPPIFWQWFALLLAEDYGVPKCVTRGMRILMVVRNRRQLRMSAGSASAERRMA